jgi:hypothetical protein
MTERPGVRKKSPNADQSGSLRPPGDPPNRVDDETPPLRGGVLVMIPIILAVVLVLGYLFVNKMADISQEEDCALAHRNN